MKSATAEGGRIVSWRPGSSRDLRRPHTSRRRRPSSRAGEVDVGEVAGALAAPHRRSRRRVLEVDLHRAAGAHPAPPHPGRRPEPGRGHVVVGEPGGQVAREGGAQGRGEPGEHLRRGLPGALVEVGVGRAGRAGAARPRPGPGRSARRRAPPRARRRSSSASAAAWSSPPRSSRSGAESRTTPAPVPPAGSGTSRTIPTVRSVVAPLVVIVEFAQRRTASEVSRTSTAAPASGRIRATDVEGPLDECGRARGHRRHRPASVAVFSTLIPRNSADGQPWLTGATWPGWAFPQVNAPPSRHVDGPPTASSAPQKSVVVAW